MQKQNKGITLIALIITIIVMLILVGVTVTVALNGGLFKTAKQATQGTETARDKELALSNGEVQIDGIIYASMDDYINNNPKLPENIILVSKEEIEANDITKYWDLTKVTVITDGTNIIPLPKGFRVSLAEGENTVAGGLVITDGTNEFVWIPVTSTYTEDNLDPLTGLDTTSNCIYDSQEQLDYYYGEGYFNYNKDFNYAEDKTNIETSINKYKGFYVGRYETTIDENERIGSMKNKTVLTADKSIPETNNKTCIWYGLYKVQKDMYALNEAVFSTMITSKEWDIIMDFTGYGSATRATDTYTTQPDLSGTAYKGTTDTYDVSKNIYDLAGNVFEWMLTNDGDSYRVFRGGIFYSGRIPASNNNGDVPFSSYCSEYRQ